MNHNIYAPNVHLFAYHFQNNKNPSLLYEKCDEILAKLKIDNFNLQQRIELKKAPEQTRVDLLKDEEISRNNNPSPPFNGEVFLEDRAIKFEGFAYPLRIHDSYALALNIRRPEKDEKKQKTEDIDLALLKQFNPDNCLLPDFITSSLGQTLLITAWLPEEQRQDYCDFWQLPDELQADKDIFLRLADDCINALISDPQKRPQFYRKGQLFGSPIFEYGDLSQNTDYKHILVWLFCNQEADKKLGECYQDLINLFFYTNKIIRSYHDSRLIYQAIKILYEKIERDIEHTEKVTEKISLLDEEDLKKLQIKLKDFAKIAPEYARRLRDLEEKRHTIAINARNYTEKLKVISKTIEGEYSSFLGNDLSFLESFRKNCRHFQEQIQADLGYAVPGSKLLDRAIASIRGIVEIDRAERDRQQEDRDKERDRDLQIALAAIGTGISVSGIVASGSTYVVDSNNKIQMPWSPSASFSPHPFTLWVLFSILLGFVSAGIVLLLRSLCRWYSKRTTHQ